MQQMRNVPPIADADLLPGVVDGGVGIGGVLQLDEAQGQAVDEQQHVRPAVFGDAVVGIFHGELVHGSEEVVLRVVEVDQCHHPGDAALRDELDPTIQP